MWIEVEEIKEMEIFLYVLHTQEKREEKKSRKDSLIRVNVSTSFSQSRLSFDHHFFICR